MSKSGASLILWCRIMASCRKRQTWATQKNFLLVWHYEEPARSDKNHKTFCGWPISHLFVVTQPLWFREKTLKWHAESGNMPGACSSRHHVSAQALRGQAAPRSVKCHDRCCMQAFMGYHSGSPAHSSDFSHALMQSQVGLALANRSCDRCLLFKGKSRVEAQKTSI